jgi:hypothetical protein
MREYANDLHQEGYIISVYHPEGADLVPPLGWTTVTWSRRYYHLSPSADLGFVRGGVAYLGYMLNNVPVITRLPYL